MHNLNVGTPHSMAIYVFIKRAEASDLGHLHAADRCTYANELKYISHLIDESGLSNN